MAMSDSSFATANLSTYELLRECLTSGALVEVVYRDSAGQVCTVHDIIQDLFSRAGRDFILLGRKTMVSIDHVLTLNGRPLP
jgi:Rho-binding antiterminator